LLNIIKSDFLYLVGDCRTPLCQKGKILFDMVINFIEVGEIKFLSCIFFVNIGNQLEFTSVVSHK